MSSTNDNVRHINMQGGSYVEGNVDTGGGDNVGGNKNVFSGTFYGPVILGDGRSTAERKRHDFYAHISLPPNYVVREELLAEVRATVLADTPAVALTSAIKSKPTALHGMGGIGKSVMARALCDDPEIQVRFKDGILWTTLGQAPDLIARLREWVETLGGTVTEAAPTINTLKARLAQLLSDHVCLLVVDDVWQHTHAEAFRVSAPHCRLLITTRDAAVAEELGATIQPVPTMTPAEAVAVLEEWADGQLADVDAGLKTQIVKRLGRLPLALRLAGAQLKRKAPGEWLKSFDARKLQARRVETVHDSLERTFALSLDALDAMDRKLYAALAIFREDEAIPEVAIQRLWSALDQLEGEDAADLLDDLAARALLDIGATAAGPTVLLHDLLRDFVRAELGAEERNTHQRLMDAYRGTWASSGWHTAANDGYLHDHLVYHLEAVAAKEELQSLFATQDWMRVRFEQRNYTYDGYLADLDVAWTQAEKNARQQIYGGEMPTAFADCFRYALIRTSTPPSLG